jgi:protoporphyrin/coproporphyrin ferrochelatase
LDVGMNTAFLLVSFGGPEGTDDVLPFLRNVTAGRGVPDERLAVVAEHYYHFGGISPINEQNRDLIAAIEKEFAASGIDLPVYWGNRNWQPYLADTMAAMAADGIERVIAFATSAYSSYSSCRQYLEDIDRARAEVGPAAPAVVKIPPYYRHPGFIAAFTESAQRALASMDHGDDADIVFTAHSIPVGMAAASGPSGGAYPAQLAEVAALIASGLGRTDFRLAYTSRSGPPTVPWLEPDISDCLTELSAEGSPGVCVIPIGFVSDHLEVRYDLDVEAARTAQRLALPMARAATPGTDARFVTMITSLVREFLDGGWASMVSALGPDAANFCAERCCGRGSGRPAGEPPGRS